MKKQIKLSSKLIIVLFIMLFAQLSFGQKQIKGKTKTLHAKVNVKAIAKPMSPKRFDESKIRKLKIWELVTKNYVLIGDDNRYYTYDGDENTIKNHLENKKRNQEQSQLKKRDCPCFKYVKLCSSGNSSGTVSTNDDGHICIMNITYNPNFDKSNKIILRQDGKVYAINKTTMLLNLIQDAKQDKRSLKQSNDNCPDGCFCFNNSRTCVSIDEEFNIKKKHIKSSKNYKKQLAEPKKNINY